MQLSKEEMSSFLMYRTPNLENLHTMEEHFKNRIPIHTSFELESYFAKRMGKFFTSIKERCGIALSGGMDSAILARYMPEGSIAYTLKCIVPPPRRSGYG